MPDRDQLGKKKKLLSKKGQKTDHVKAWTCFKRLLAYVTWSCASTHSLNLYCDGKTECPWFSTHPQPQDSSEGHKAQHPTTLRHTHTLLPEGSCVNLGSQGAWKEIEAMTPNKEGTPNPDPSSISLTLCKLVGVVCIPQAHTGRGLSSQLLQNPVTQDLQSAASMLCSPLAFSEIRNISAKHLSSQKAAVKTWFYHFLWKELITDLC